VRSAAAAPEAEGDGLGRGFSLASVAGKVEMTTKPLFLLLAVAVAGLSPVVGARESWAQPASQPDAPTQKAESRGERVARLERERLALRAEIAALRPDRAAQAGTVAPAVEARVAELERRVRELEAELAKLRADALRATAGTATPADAPGLEPADLFGQGGQVTAGRAFNPAISVIPDGVYYNDNRQGAAGEIASGAAGFHAHGLEEGGHAHGSLERGFNLRELEVSFSGSVDPYFDAWAILAVAGGEVEAEEAYVQTRKFVPGLQIRFGKFFSGIGYLNRQHPHQWDFVDQALPYDLLFGGQVNEVGVQVNWLPSLPFYTLLGFEALQGENAGVSQHLGPDTAPAFGDMAGPRLFTGFAKVAPEVGYAGTLQFGASVGRSRQHQELHGEEEVMEALEGPATFLGFDAVYRYDSGREWGVGDVTVQGEYFRRWKDLAFVGTDPVPSPGPALDFTQDGLYAQAVYGFAARWTAAFRFDVAGLVNSVEGEAGAASEASSRRYTANVTFNPTEFSRLRLQYTRGDFAAESGRETYNQVWVQFQVSLGAHGAHRF
jgi:hypothetical protein